MMKLTTLLKESRTYTGDYVAQHIKDITPDEDMIPDYFISKYIKPNDGWERKSIRIKDLLKTDESFKEYFDSGEDRYYGYDMDEDDLNLELVVYNGNLLDGYSRATKLLNNDFNAKTNAFVLDIETK